MRPKPQGEIEKLKRHIEQCHEQMRVARDIIGDMLACDNMTHAEKAGILKVLRKYLREVDWQDEEIPF